MANIPAYLQALAATQASNQATDYNRAQSEIQKQKWREDDARRAEKRHGLWKTLGTGIGFAVNPLFGASLGGNIAEGFDRGDWSGLGKTIQGYQNMLQQGAMTFAGGLAGGLGQGLAKNALASKLGGAGAAMAAGGTPAYLRGAAPISGNTYDPNAYPFDRLA